MRITRIDVGAFGPLASGLSLEPGPGLNLLVAPNEAGKTSLARLIAFLLYGPRSRGMAATREAFAPWSGNGGGEVGGAMAYSLADGRAFTLSRHLTASGQRLELHGPGGSVDTGGVEPGELHLGLSRGAFRTVSSIGLDDLMGAFGRGGGDQSRRELMGRFFLEAATRGELANPAQVLKEWQAQAAALHHPHRNRGKDDAVLAEEIRAAREELEAALAREERAHELAAELERLDREAAGLAREEASAQAALERASSGGARPEPPPGMEALAQGLAAARQEEAQAWTDLDALGPELPSWPPLLAMGLGLAALAGGVKALLWSHFAAAPLWAWALGAGLAATGLGLGIWGIVDRQRRGAYLARAGELEARASAANEQARPLADELQQAVLAHARAGLERARDQAREKGQRRGAAQEALAGLNRQASAATARAALEALEERRQELAQRHGALTLAAHLLSRAMERFRLEAQPRLLEQAAGLMASATNGGYTWLGSDLLAPRSGEPRLSARAAPGAAARPAQALSRGTRDLLYLCLRLALARELSGGEPVPLILDDPLVNADDDRLAASLAVIAQEAARRQVWLLTCHDRQAQILRGIAQPTLLELRPPA